jgi:pSer/pThr/pTyr-binding forkhead associated (FHA) protein
MEFQDLLGSVLDMEVEAFAARYAHEFLLEVSATSGSRLVFALVVGTRKELLIGRSASADLRLDDSQVSTRHARLVHDGKGWQITDLASLNGTFVGHAPLPPEASLPLAAGMTVTFGTRAEFTFHGAVSLHQALRLEQRGRQTERVERPEALGPKLSLVCSPLLPTPLVEGREVSVGRTEGNDVVLPHPSVSRRHVSFTRQGDEVLVKDLGSSNGVVIGGQAVKGEVTLRAGGPSIAVGVYELRIEDTDAPSRRTRPEDEGTASLKADALRGRLETMPLFELLQTIEANERAGFVVVETPEGEKGQIHFKDGRPLRALLGEQRGVEAILGLLALRAGAFTTTFWAGTADVGPPEIDWTFTKLLLEYSRRKDELSR